jgi:hypothetical protein
MGVALLDHRIYVICDEYSNISIYSADPPYDRFDDINVEGMKVPRDMAACRETNRLYISDNWGDQCVWCVPMCGKPSRWISDNRAGVPVRPRSLSVTSGRLLVTTWDNGLFQYGPDGKQLKHITLPDYIYPQHAIEKTSGSFIVCHTGHGDDQHDQVSKVDVDGRVVRVYGGQRGHSPHQLNWPRHLAQDSAGRVFVADFGNRRILVLKPELELEGVLVTLAFDDLSKPWRLCYVENTGQLVVGEVGYHVKMYSVPKSY